jgi:dTDP-4-dehydrorhamnose 3,5-epimerase
MGRFKLNQTRLQGVYLIEPEVFGDDRGYFFESYHEKDFFQAGLRMRFVQDNESKSKRGVLRGLHFQRFRPQGKLVRVLEGEIYDVALDLRRQGGTYGEWVGERLSSANKRQLYIPGEFAHGFLVLSETATVAYKCTDYYFPQEEDGIIYDDKDLNIPWPLEAIDRVFLSEKDASQKSFKELISPF